MYRVKGGVKKGVLNDYDLAYLAVNGKHQGGHPNGRTGTIPFMAIDPLDETAGEGEGRVCHLYRHDLESFFWVLVWVVSCYEEGVALEPIPEPFANWINSAGTQTTLGMKIKFLVYRRNKWPIQESWKPFAGALTEIRDF